MIHLSNLKESSFLFCDSISIYIYIQFIGCLSSYRVPFLVIKMNLLMLYHSVMIQQIKSKVNGEMRFSGE